MRDRHLALVGPTASGKSALAMELARQRPGSEIISVDSMCVYRKMDIGTAKPSPADRAEVTHHLIDLVDPAEEYSLKQFQSAARHAICDIEERGNRALLVGGTALYLRAITDDLELPGRWPDIAAELIAESEQPGGTERLFEQLSRLDNLAASRMEPTNTRRIVRALEVTLGAGRPFSTFGPGLQQHPDTRFDLVGIWPPETRDNIGTRFEQWMAEGFLDEVRELLLGELSRTARQALGYRELLLHVEEGRPIAECVAEAIRRTRLFAKRQLAWYRRDPRMIWIEPQVNMLSEVWDRRVG